MFVAFQTEMWLATHDLTPVKLPETPNELIRMPAAGFVQ